MSEVAEMFKKANKHSSISEIRMFAFETFEEVKLVEAIWAEGKKNGMTANELGQHFGRPRLQIREGDGTKLQFAGPNCVLDAYLYPSTSGAGLPRVTYIDTRNLQGAPVNAQNCIASLEAN